MRNSAAISDPYPRRRILVGLGVQSDADLEIYQGVVDHFAAGNRCDVVPIGMDFERRVSQLAAKGGVDGIIGEFAGGGWLTALQRQGIPVVHVRQSFAVDDLPAVGIDYRTAGRLGAEFLLESAVSRLVWVGSGTSLPASELLDGLRGRFPGEVVRMELDAVVNDPLAVKGNCLCFAESRIAGPLVRSLNDHGLSIPRDITLLAFGR
jgi:DNA-binding LacI/PurR family transcriptional regulator